jgi:hypothetical protein
MSTLYRVIINDCPIAVDKLVDSFSPLSVSPFIDDTSLTHVMRLAAHSTTSPTPTVMGQSFIITL